MKFSDKSFIFLIVIICAETAWWLNGHPITPPPHSHIAEITQINDLQTLLTNTQPTVIMGYMNHCPHCNKLLKYFESLPKKHSKVSFFITNGPHVKLHEQIAKFKKDKNNNFKIPGYPSLVLVKNGKPLNVQIGGNEKTLDENIKNLLK